jgi:hypothetical protein
VIPASRFGDQTDGLALCGIKQTGLDQPLIYRRVKKLIMNGVIDVPVTVRVILTR